MKKSLSYITKLCSLLLITSNFSFAQDDEPLLDEHDIVVDIKKKENTNRRDNGQIDNTSYEISVVGKKKKTNIDALSVKYEIFYFTDNNDLRKGGTYKSVKGSFDVSSTSATEDNPKKTVSVAIHDTVTIERRDRGRRNNRRNNNNNNNNRLDRIVTGKREDELFGVLVDVLENGKIIATYADTQRVLRRVEGLRDKNEQVTPQSFK